MNTLRHELLGKTHETRAELSGQIEALREKTERDKAELLGLINDTRAEPLGKIEAVRLPLDRKLTLFFVVLLSVVLFTNREALELIGRLLGLLK